MAEPVFSLTNVSYTYHSENIHALSGLNLTINKGERAVIIGANGSGKSTLLMLLDALAFASGGEVRAFGELLTDQSMRKMLNQRSFRSKVGFVFQNPDIQLFCPTVKEDILFGPLQLGIDETIIQERFHKVVECMKIGHLLDRSPHHLSIGEKKKVSIASVLIMETEVILFDEPTAGLDPATGRIIIEVINNAHLAGKTVIMATHDLHIVEEIADIVHVFGSNRSVIRSGTPEDILSDRIFLQENNLIHIHVHRHLHTHHTHEH